MNIKTLFEQAEGGTLTWEQFQEASEEAGAKFTDLSEGNYISKRKYESEIADKTKTIENLNTAISTRDTDLTNLKKQLDDAGTDANKLSELSNQLTTLQTNYDEATKKYEEQLKQQAYEFAVKEFAASQNFSSKAAKRDFTQSMINENLKFENNEIVGADDFVKKYLENNEDAFITEADDISTPESNQLPQFVSTTQGGQPTPVESNAFINAFHFTGVRPMPNADN